MTRSDSGAGNLHWLEEARVAVNADPAFRRLGSADVVLGLAIDGEARLITFEAFEVTAVRTVTMTELRDAEIVLKMSAVEWAGYLDDRRQGGGSSLLTLDLDSHLISARDPIARLKLARFNRSLQAFIDAGAPLAA